MQQLDKENIIQSKINDLMIPADKVAHVQSENSLEHALLVLIKSGYSAVPVLDSSYMLTGLISKTMILEAILGIETIEIDRLPAIKVKEVMEKEIPTLKESDEFIRALGLTINHAFVCVKDEDGFFQGIVTRRAILKLFTKHL